MNTQIRTNNGTLKFIAEEKGRDLIVLDNKILFVGKNATQRFKKWVNQLDILGED